MSTRFRDVIQKAKPDSTLAWVLVAVVLVLVLAGGGVGIWLLVRQSKRAKTKKKIAKSAVTAALPAVPAVSVQNKAKCDPDDPKQWEYVRRLQASNGEWLCPAGWIDTGCNWVDGAENGEKQCKAPRRIPLVAPTPPPPPPPPPVAPLPPAASASTQWALQQLQLQQQLQQFRDQLQAQQAQQAQQPQQPRIVVISAGGAQGTAVVSPPTGPPASTPLPTQAPQAQSPYVWRGKPPSTAKPKPPPSTPAASGGEVKTNITFYGQSSADDNGQGMSGVDLFKHGTAGIKHENRPVYPGAVHQKDFAKLAYKVVEVRGNGLNTVLLHIVDMCDEKDDSCRANVKKNGLNFLVDVHATAFRAIGGKNDGVLTGTYRVVGEIRPSKLPASVWASSDIMCSCTGNCSGKSVKWTRLSECKS